MWQAFLSYCALTNLSQKINFDSVSQYFADLLIPSNLKIFLFQFTFEDPQNAKS